MGLFSKKKKDKNLTNQEWKGQEQLQNTWICPKCQTKNAITSISCKDCGHYK